MAVTVLYVAAFIALFAGYLAYTALKPGLRNIPGPFISKFTRLENVRSAMSGSLHIRQRELHQRYGDVVRTGPNHVSFSDPKLIPTVFGIKSDFSKSKFYTVFTGNDEGVPMADLFSIDDRSVHKVQKRNVSSIYAMSSLVTMEKLVDECAEFFMAKMEELLHSEIDLGSWLQWYAFDVISNVTFSKPLGFMATAGDVRSMIRHIDQYISYSAVVGQVPELHTYLLLGSPWFKFLSNSLQFMRDMNPMIYLIDFTKEKIRSYDGLEKSSSNSSSKDFLTKMLDQQHVRRDQFSDADILTHCSVNIGAGSDTTAISLRAIIYYLIKNPTCWQKLANEIDALDQQGKLSTPVTFSEAQNMTYLQACIKEGMRIHPGVGFPLERFVPEGGMEVSGYFIPAGTIVGINAWIVHANKEVFGEDAEQFRPERWIEADEDQLKNMDRAFLSFGHGTRSCIGKNIAMLEMSKLVPLLIRNFNIEMATPGAEWKLTNRWFVRQSGLICRFSRRASKSHSSHPQ